MKTNYRKTRALIDLAAIENNLKFIKSYCSSVETFFCPMVKSNGYGHGDVKVAQVCEKVGVSGVGVALLEEGIKLRKAGIQTEIFVFGPILDHAVEELYKFNLTPVIGQWPELKAINSLTSRCGQKKIHLKFNTGMHRLGFAIDQAEPLKQYFEDNTGLQLTGICSHLSDGDDVAQDNGHSQKQIHNMKLLEQTFQCFSPAVHMWNSSGWFSYHSQKSKDATISSWGVRPGISVYGVQPLKELHFDQLQPAMSLLSEVVTLQKVKKGESVSYGSTWTANRDSVIAVVPIGYADGFSRSFSSNGKMLVGNTTVPVVGIVCMDYTLVDLTDLDIDFSQDLGKEVVIIGSLGDQKLTAEDLAEMIQTIPYEILTCIGRRVPREYKGHL